MSSQQSLPPSGPKILIVGFGALGALYAWILSKGGAQIYALARSNAKTLLTRGIDIQSEIYGKDNYKPYKVLSSSDEAALYEPYDYVLCTMKIVPEEEKTGSLLLKLLRGNGIHSALPRQKRPTIVFVENGIGIEEEPLETLVRGQDAVASTIISCCAWLGATLTNGGTVVEHGSMEQLIMGLYPAPDPAVEGVDELRWRKEKLQLIHDIYKRGGGGAVLIEGDIQPLRWRKCEWSPHCARLVDA
jgi:2-dehydropantoate 2-reductase